MKRLFIAVALPAALALTTLGALPVLPASAAVTSHTTMMARTWHGTVEKLNLPMGATESFSLKVGMKSYTVHYSAMTHWVMGSKKNLKAGALVTVTGTLAHSTISATKLSA